MEKKIDVVQMQADLSNFSSEYETIRHDDLMQVLSRLEQAEQDAYGFREGYEILKRALIKQGERLEQAEQAVARVRELADEAKIQEIDMLWISPQEILEILVGEQS